MTLFSLTTGHFLTVKNLTNVLRQVSMIGISTVGMTMIIISGGIDLSVGSVVSLTGIVLAKLLVIGISVPLAILITLCVGVLLGWINGFLINKLSIPPLIAALGQYIYGVGSSEKVSYLSGVD